MHHVSNDPGYYRYVVTPAGRVLERARWGAPATSFPVVAGVMTIAELQSGVIGHALGLAITNTCAGVGQGPPNGPRGLTRTLRTGGCTSPDWTRQAHPRGTAPPALRAHDGGRGPELRDHHQQPLRRVTFRGEDPTQYEAEHGYNPYTGPDGEPGIPGALYDD